MYFSFLKFLFFGLLLIHLQTIGAFCQYEGLQFPIKPDLLAKIKEIEKIQDWQISFEYADISEIYNDVETDKSDQLLSFDRHIRLIKNESESKKGFVKIDKMLKGDEKKIEAEIDHLLLHLRSRQSNFPHLTIFETHGCPSKPKIPNPEIFVFLESMLYHQIYRPEFEKIGYYELFDVENKLIERTKAHFNDYDSVTLILNYVHAVLIMNNKENLEKIRQIYLANKGESAIKKGNEIANLIARGNLNTPTRFTNIFISALNKLYSRTKPFRVNILPILKIRTVVAFDGECVD